MLENKLKDLIKRLEQKEIACINESHSEIEKGKTEFIFEGQSKAYNNCALLLKDLLAEENLGYQKNGDYRFSDKTVSLKQPTNVIFRGSFASGKTYTSEVIANFFNPEKVLRIDAYSKNLVGITREIVIGDFDLIIFDECIDSKHINNIDKNVIQKVFKGGNVIYLTQNDKFKSIKGFTIVECKYS